MSEPTPTGTAQWWDAFPDLSKPMIILLYSAVDRSRPDVGERGRIDLTLYPAGQTRMIVQGLYNRNLITTRGTLTGAGWAVARKIRDAVEHAHPAGPPPADTGEATE